MTIRAVLFDKDGTLVDFHATYDAATAQVLNTICDGDTAKLNDAASILGFDLESGRIGEDSVIVAGTGYDITSCLQPILNIEDVAAYSRYLDKLYGEICLQTVKWLPGVRQGLDELHAGGFLLGIATNDSEANAVSQMSTLSAAHLFHRILGADSGFGGKPGPGMIKAFAGDCGYLCSEIMMVGDSTHDLQAGNSAGAVTCAVETGPADRAHLEREADYVAGSVVDLPALLARLM